MLDYAGQMDLIDKIKSGYDVHAATGEKVGVSRSKAKAINFGILYGIGDAEFARELGITIYEAKSLKAEYFGALPDVHRFIVNVKKRARDSGYVFNGMGRKNHLPKVPGRKMDYVMVNHLIQGYCADIMKKALWLCGEYLEANRCRSRMVLTVHDELLFYIHPEEMDIIPKLKHLMESAYDYRYLPLTCSAEISSTSWHDKKPWVAGGEKT